MAEHGTSEKPDTSGIGSSRVLVVDDEGPVRTVTVRMLTGKALAVEGVGSADEALRLLADPGRLFDVVLLDMTMPGLSGKRAVDAIHAARPGLPVVVMTGYSDLDAAPLLKAGTVTGFIRKPFTTADLIYALAAALA